MSWVVSVADAGCMTIGVSAASEKQARACSSCEGGASPPGLPSARVTPSDTVLVTKLRRPAAPPGSQVGGERLPAHLHPTQPSSVASGHRQPSVPPHLLGPVELRPLQIAGGDSPLRLLLPQVSTFTPQQSQRPPQTLRHRVSALLFDKTGRHGSGPGPARPAPLSGPRRALTPLVRLQLCLQVLGGHVEAGVLARGRPGLAPPAAAVEAAAEAAAAVAAGEEAAHDKQRLRGWTTGALATRPPGPPPRGQPEAAPGACRAQTPSAALQGPRSGDTERRSSVSFWKGSLQGGATGLTGQHHGAGWPGPSHPRAFTGHGL